MAILCKIGIHKWGYIRHKRFGLTYVEIVEKCSECPKIRTKIYDIHSTNGSPYDVLNGGGE